MVIQEVYLRNVRCHRELRLGFGGGLTILVGPNGAGKTTVLEGLVLALRGESLRSSPPGDLITSGQDYLRVEVLLAESGRQEVAEPARGSGMSRVAAVAYSRTGEKRVTVDGAAIDGPGRWRDSIPLLTFMPDDLRLVKGSPARRREYLDRLAAQQEPAHKDTVAQYEQALSQRNALLRSPGVSTANGLFSPWERILADTGLRVCDSRARAVGRFVRYFQEEHAALTGLPPESVRLVYRTNVAGLTKEAYQARLAESRTADRQRTFTHLGPHRDDLRILREGLDVREYASQGEQRMAVLSLVLAEWRILRERPDPPVLLLDDVMSELDEARRRALVRALREGGQVVVTTVDLGYFAEEELQEATIVTVSK